jgi:hexulose-6-phosphate isomerase
VFRVICRIRKGINIWSFDQNLSIGDCMRLAKTAGFEGIELALSAGGPLGLKTPDDEIVALRRQAERIGIEINSLATGLYWQYSLTSNRPEIREQAMAIVRRQLEVGKLLGVDCVLVVPGTVGVDFKPEDVVPDAAQLSFFAGSEIIPYDVAYERSCTALRRLAIDAETLGVAIGIENIWNKFLLSPLEMRAFIDEIGSPQVGVLFDVGNIIATGYPEQWIRILGQRIRKVHFKDYRRSVGSLAGFVDLLAGDVNWPAVISAFQAIGYDGWANAEMCPAYHFATDQIVYNTSAAMDRILQL